MACEPKHGEDVDPAEAAKPADVDAATWRLALVLAEIALGHRRIDKQNPSRKEDQS